MALIYCYRVLCFFQVVLSLSVFKSGNILEIVIYVIQFVFKYLFKVEYLIYGLMAL